MTQNTEDPPKQEPFVELTLADYAVGVSVAAAAVVFCWVLVRFLGPVFTWK